MNLRDIGTVFWRDWIVLKRRLVKFIFSRMVAPLLYLTAFGLGLGRSVNLNSGTYLDFIVPGIIALNSMNITVFTASFRFTPNEFIIKALKNIYFHR